MSNETLRCQHCGRDIARLHKNKTQIVVPIRGAVIVKTETERKRIIARALYENSYDEIIMKNRVKCGNKNCQKHTTFNNVIYNGDGDI